MKIISLLPMKAHSERVPNKNMREFLGTPLYHAIIKVLLESKYIEKIAIDTDSDLIAEDIQKHFKRVEIIWRPKEIQGDFVSMNEIIAYDLSRLEGDHFLQTHATNPLLTRNTLDSAIGTYFENLNRFDSLFSVTRFQTRLYWGNGQPINHNLAELLRTQDLPPVFEENSNLYIFSKESFKKAGNNRIGLHPQMFEISKLESVDIDEPEDWKIAEVLYEMYRKK